MRLYLSLLKLRIVALLVIVAGLSAYIAQGDWPPGGRLGLLLLSGALAAGGASALNHYLDRDIDSLMERTRRRPLPLGRLKPGWALSLGLVLIAASLPLSLRVNGWVALYILLGALFYVGVYTWWLKRRIWLNIVIGGMAGSFAALAGWAAVEPRLSGLALLIALLVFLWTPLHFWNFALVYQEDYRRAQVPMLPVVVGEAGTKRQILGATLALFLGSLLPWALGYLGTMYLVLALVLAPLLLGNFRLLWRPEVAWTNYKLSGLYLIGLLLAMALDLTLT